MQIVFEKLSELIGEVGVFGQESDIVFLFDVNILSSGVFDLVDLLFGVLSEILIFFGVDVLSFGDLDGGDVLYSGDDDKVG